MRHYFIFVEVVSRDCYGLMLQRKDGRSWAQGPPIVELLDMCHKREAPQLHDKLYGLLGLCISIEPWCKYHVSQPDRSCRAVRLVEPDPQDASA
jgi:hypothetical protein